MAGRLRSQQLHQEDLEEGPLRRDAKLHMNEHRRVAMLLLSAVLLLTACDQFGTQGVIDTCVRNAMKESAPFGSSKERADTEAQLKESCAKAAGRH
jgi:hypothetical protein